jgi:hypothetical protein
MKKKNVIWFVVDQMQGMAMGVNGDPNVFTPNLDNMAIGGTNFNRAVSGYPLCCPFRATMLTGLYANNHSVKLHQDRLDPSYRTVTDVLKDNHYENNLSGKNGTWEVLLRERSVPMEKQELPPLSFPKRTEAALIPGSDMRTTTVSGTAFFMAMRMGKRSLLTGFPVMKRIA